jgi:hypothetical protein
MRLFLETLRQETDTYTVEAADSGFVIVRKPGVDGAFDEIARRVINDAGDTFAAFPRADGQGGYDSVLILPMDTAGG